MFGWIKTLSAARRLRRSDALFMTQSGGDPDPAKRSASIQFQYYGPDALERCQRDAQTILSIINPT